MTLQEKVKFLPKYLSVTVLCISGIILFAWFVTDGNPPFFLKHVKFNTAICLGLTSVCIWLKNASSNQLKSKMILLSQMFSLMSLAIAGTIFIQYVSGIEYGIDQIFVTDNSAHKFAMFPGRSSPGTIVSLLFLNLGLLFLDLGLKSLRLFSSLALLVPATFLPLFAFIGHIYGEEALYQYLPEIRMSWVTSLSLLMLSLAALLCRPKESPLEVLVSDAIGGVASRRLLPFIFFMPVLTGYFMLALIRANYLNYHLGFALLCGGLIVLLMSVVLFTGAKLDDLDKQRVKLIDELAHAVRAREDILSIASHEMKTPLTSMLLQTQILQRNKKEKLDDRIVKYINLIETQVIKLNRLIEDMLDFSRINSDKLILKKEEFDLCELTSENLERLRPVFEKSGSGVPEFGFCKDTTGLWDRMRIEQVLNNLLTNAIRYGESKPISVQISDLGDKVQLSVKDKGLGISPDKKDKIFDRFERGGMTKETSGLGLGLYITRQIVLAHSGKVWVESEVGEGSTFFVELPRHS